MRNFLLVLNLRPQEYSSAYTQCELSQLDLVIKNQSIASGLNNSMGGEGVCLEEDDVVYISYTTIHNDIAVIAKAVVGGSYFNSVSNWFNDEVPSSFLRVSAKYNKLSRCISVNYPTKSHYIKKPELERLGFIDIQTNVFYDLELPFVDVIDKKYQFSSTDIACSVVKHSSTYIGFTDMFPSSSYLHSKKSTCLNRMDGRRPDNNNRFAFYDAKYSDYASSIIKSMNANIDDGVMYRGQRDRLLWTRIDANTYNVHFQGEDNDLDFDFEYSSFKSLNKQCLNKDYLYVPILDNDVFATEPLRSLDDDFRPLKMSLLNAEQKENTSYMPDGIIIGFNLKNETDAIDIKITELKSRPTYKHLNEFDSSLLSDAYLEQIDKFCNVFSVKNLHQDKTYREFKFYDGIFVDIRDDFDTISFIRRHNTSYKYAILITEYICSLLDANNGLFEFLKNRFDVDNIVDVKKNLSEEIMDTFNNGKGLSYILVIDNPVGIAIDEIKNKIRFHGFNPEIYSVERFYIKGTKTFQYKFKHL